jgi:WhiB family redox-sensing transcriptional regulator
VAVEVTVDEMPEEYAWMLHALCRGAQPTEFFPSDGLGVEAAQRVCLTCTVKAECLEYALQHRIEHGVWGGASERERRRILRRRRDMTPLPTDPPAPTAPAAMPAPTAPQTHAVVQA